MKKGDGKTQEMHYSVLGASKTTHNLKLPLTNGHTFSRSKLDVMVATVYVAQKRDGSQQCDWERKPDIVQYFPRYHISSRLASRRGINSHHRDYIHKVITSKSTVLECLILYCILPSLSLSCKCGLSALVEKI